MAERKRRRPVAEHIRILVTSSGAINQLMAELTTAKKKSRHNGGGRSVFIHPTAGPVVEIVVDLTSEALLRFA